MAVKNVGKFCPGCGEPVFGPCPECNPNVTPLRRRFGSTPTAEVRIEEIQEEMWVSLSVQGLNDALPPIARKELNDLLAMAATFQYENESDDR